MTMRCNLFKSGELVWDAATARPALVIDAYVVDAYVVDARPRYDLYYWTPPIYGALTPLESNRGIDEHDLTPLNINTIKKLRADGYLSDTRGNEIF